MYTLKQKAKSSTRQTWRLRLVVFFLSNVVVGKGQEAWHLLHVGGLLVLTENIRRCVQQILASSGKNALSNNLHNNLFLPASVAPQSESWWLGHVEPDDVVIADIGGQALDIFLHGPESAHKNGIVKTFTHTSISIHPCTLLN